jgi:hypothetical protein
MRQRSGRGAVAEPSDAGAPLADDGYYQRLAARGKAKQHIVTAVARELTGFLWATLTQ